jgi:hypothetical protein
MFGGQKDQPPTEPEPPSIFQTYSGVSHAFSWSQSCTQPLLRSSHSNPVLALIKRGGFLSPGRPLN